MSTLIIFLLVQFVFNCFFAVIWRSNDFPNALLKVFLIIMTIVNGFIVFPMIF